MKDFLKKHILAVLVLICFIGGCVTGGGTSFTYNEPNKTITYERDEQGKINSQYGGGDRSWSLETNIEPTGKTEVETEEN